jgi:protein gp37
MAETSKIEWTEATWNVITGCSVVSPGCTNCYAMRLAGTRLQHHPSRAGLTRDSKAGPVWTGETRLNEEWLDQPLNWRRPRRIFVCAHGDLFHESVPDEWIDRVFAVMALAGQHTFQVLTKRAARMRAYVAADRMGRIEHFAKRMMRERSGDPSKPVLTGKTLAGTWPWSHVHLGVSAEDQKRADERIPDLLATPAAVRFVSAEPLLGPLDLTDVDYVPYLDSFRTRPRENPDDPNWPALRYDVLRGHMKGPDDIGLPKLDWVIAGGESGPGARPMHPDWIRSLRDQCTAAGVPFFFKQWGNG